MVLGANAAFFPPFHYEPAAFYQGQGVTNWNYQSVIVRKAAQSQGRNFLYVSAVEDYSNQARADLEGQLSRLQQVYNFVHEELIRDFLISHRAVRTVLRDATEPLREAFGADKVFSLEVSVDEDGSQTLYALAIWQADVRSASAALHNFLENWWLDRLNAATSDLAFAYKLV